jgi:hypothetical protein
MFQVRGTEVGVVDCAHYPPPPPAPLWMLVYSVQSVDKASGASRKDKIEN